MEPRLNPFAAAPTAMQAWLEYGKGVLQCGLEDSLMELVKIRASQINGCASCLYMHTASAREHGETESASIYSMPGANHRSTACASAPRSNGPKP